MYVTLLTGAQPYWSFLPYQFWARQFSASSMHVPSNPSHQCWEIDIIIYSWGNWDTRKWSNKLKTTSRGGAKILDPGISVSKVFTTLLRKFHFRGHVPVLTLHLCSEEQRQPTLGTEPVDNIGFQSWAVLFEKQLYPELDIIFSVLPSWLVFLSLRPKAEIWTIF